MALSSFLSNPSVSRLKRGVMTLTGLSRQGFFTPYRYAGSVPDDVENYAEIEAMMHDAAPGMRAVLDQIQALAPDLAGFSGNKPGPRWTQDWFPRLDGAATYALVRQGKPRRIVEIGSGHSTRFLAKAVADGGFDCAITAIDPQPRADLKGLDVRWIEAMFAAEHFHLTDELAAGDVLFIDSSHILWPGSDVDMLFARVLPRLAHGVMVHIHDIFLPEGYPAHWRWRGYTEQQGVSALLAGGGYDIAFASWFAHIRLDPLAIAPVLRELPMLPEAVETSLWLRKATNKVWRP